MLPGSHDPEEIIKSVKKGIFAKDFSGGQVDITNGKFVFSTSEAYLIEDGKIGAPVKGATLIGDGPTAVGKISMVGNDLTLDSGGFTCGKNGQGVPVGIGLPTTLVDELTVHHDQNKSTQSLFVTDVTALVEIFDSLGNPFKDVGNEGVVARRNTKCRAEPISSGTVG